MHYYLQNCRQEEEKKTTSTRMSSDWVLFTVLYMAALWSSYWKRKHTTVTQNKNVKLYNMEYKKKMYPDSI